MNILIVDDLVSVVNGIENGIDWKKLNIDSVFKAHNAYEAKIIIKNVPIDILLTDIEMPGESGIDLVAWVHAENKDIECIFMSSHADFDYARRALQTGSCEYVLLPCPNEEIEDVIGKAVMRLNSRREKDKVYQYGKVVTEDVWLEKMLLKHSITTAQNQDAIERLIHIGSIKAQACGYLVYIKLQENAEQFAQWDMSLLEFIIGNISHELMQPVHYHVIVSGQSKDTFVIFCQPEETQDISETAFERQMHMIHETMTKVLHLQMYMCFERCTDYAQMSAISHRLEENAKTVLLDTQEASGDTTQVIACVEEYVKEHIAYDVKRSDLANHVHMNVDYLSRIFKREKGVTLNEFIIESKMAVARNLLQTTRLPVGLVAARVGYSDFSYFSKLYKKSFGHTPTEERG